MIGCLVMRRWAEIADKFPRKIMGMYNMLLLFDEFGVATVTISIMS
jgi:hypothetical protein